MSNPSPGWSCSPVVSSGSPCPVLSAAQALLGVAACAAGTGQVPNISPEGGAFLVLVFLLELLTQQSEGLSSLPLVTTLGHKTS